MRIRHLPLYSLLLLIISVAFIPGVYATFKYAQTGPDDVAISIPIELVEFYYKPEEVLPSGGNATQLHENHFNLVKNIVDHIDYGLNATKKPLIRKLLEDGAGVVYSNQNVSGGNLKHMMLDSSDVENLMFAVEYVSDTEYNAYTFSGNDADYDTLDQYITVYKTQIIKGENNKWVAERSFMGKAQVFRAHSDGISVNVKTWYSV